MRNTVNDFCYPVNKEEKKWILFGFDLEGVYYNVPYDSRRNAELAMEEGKKLYPCLVWDIIGINRKNGDLID